jgi:hypothetical protein
MCTDYQLFKKVEITSAVNLLTYVLSENPFDGTVQNILQINPEFIFRSIFALDLSVL